MKIALVNQPYDRVLPPNPTSIGLIAYMSAVELAGTADVMLLCGAQAQQPPAGLAFPVQVVDAPIDAQLRRLAQRFPRWAGPLRLQKMADRHAQYVSRVARALDDSAPDVVHIMNYWAWCGALARRDRGRKIVLEMHCEWLSQQDADGVGRQLQSVDCIVAVSGHIAGLVRRAVPSFKGPIVTAYNGVDVDFFVPASQSRVDLSQRAPRVLFVGRVSPEKGVHTLIEAFAAVVRRFPDARLDLIGGRFELPPDFLVGISDDPLVKALGRFYDGSTGGNYQQYLDGLVRRLGLEGRVRFLGPLPHEQLLEAYRSADVLVNPSLSESFGITVVEAMACGVPVVVTCVGGMKETVLHAETGLQVEADQPHALGAAVTSILEEPALAARMSVAGRKRAAEQFSWRARAQRLLGAYRAIGADA